MKKTFFASCVIGKDEHETEQDFTLEYYLITCRMKEKGSDIFTDIYGIEVIKKYTDASGNCVSQKSTASNLTTNKKHIYTMLTTLYNQKITPVCLCEVIDDVFYEDSLNILNA